MIYTTNSDLNAYIRIYAYFPSLRPTAAKLNTEKPLLMVLLSPLISLLALSSSFLFI